MLQKDLGLPVPPRLVTKLYNLSLTTVRESSLQPKRLINIFPSRTGGDWEPVITELADSVETRSFYI